MVRGGRIQEPQSYELSASKVDEKLDFQGRPRPFGGKTKRVGNQNVLFGS